MPQGCPLGHDSCDRNIRRSELSLNYLIHLPCRIEIFIDLSQSFSLNSREEDCAIVPHLLVIHLKLGLFSLRQ